MPGQGDFQEALRLHGAGRAADAIPLYERVLKREPGNAAVLHNLGMAWWQTGRAQKALPLVRRALAKDPANASAHNTMGLIHTTLRDYKAAEKDFTQALALRPDYAEGHFNLARLYFVQTKWKETLRAAGTLLALRPDHKIGKILRFAALVELGRYQDFDELAQGAFEGMPENAFTLYLKGRINFLCGRVAPALEEYEKALALDPAYNLALQGKAAALIEDGAAEAARECLARILDAEPGHILALKMLAGVHKFSKEDEVWQRLKKADRKQGGYPDHEKAELFYAWAKYFGDLGDAENTFSYWEKAGAAKFATFDYQYEDERARFAAVRKIFAQKQDIKPAKAASGITPVFIVGMPRSGTTLMEQVLASHPQVRDGGESRFLSQAIGKVSRFEGLPADMLQKVGERYLDWLTQQAPGARYITDKMPYNYQYLGFIPQMLPQAKIIHMQRHPLDVCASCFGILFHSGHEWSYDLRELGRYYALYDELMQHWRTVMPEGSFIEVRYEDLVSGMESKVREVLEYCELPWNPACLEFYKNTRSVRTASTQQVRRPLYTSSIGRWKMYEKQFAPLAEVLAPIIKRQGYEL